MPRANQAAGGKLTGPCRLCTAKRSSSWRRIPAAAGSAAGLTACNPCYVYIAKQARDDPDGIPEALDACRAANRARLAPAGQPQDDGDVEDEEDEEGLSDEETASPDAAAGSSGGGFMDLLLHNNGGRAPAMAAAPTAAAGSSPAPGESSVRVGDSCHVPAAATPAVIQPGGGQLVGLAVSDQRRPKRQCRQRSPSPPPRLVSTSSGPQPGVQLSAMPPPAEQQLVQRQQTLPAGLPAQLSTLPSSSLAPPAAVHSGADGGARLRALRDACCRLFGDSELAQLAMRRAYYSATGQLPGASPQLLASLPCCWLLLPGASRQPQPAGALLLSVQLPPRGLNSDAQLLLLGAGMGLESAMRLVVYCPQTGQLLQCREWVQQDEQALYLHPHHRVPTWDSSEGWKLLFPDPASDMAQARLLSGIIEAFGCPPRPAPAVPSFTVGSGSPERMGTAGSSSLAEAATLLHSQAASTAVAQPPLMATPVQPRQLPPQQRFDLPSPQQQQQQPQEEQQFQPVSPPSHQGDPWPGSQLGGSHSAAKQLAWHAAMRQAERGAGQLQPQPQPQPQAALAAATPLLSLAQHPSNQPPLMAGLEHSPSSASQQAGTLDLPKQWPVRTGPTANSQGGRAQTAAAPSWRRTAEALQQAQAQAQVLAQQQQAQAQQQAQQQAQAQAQQQQQQQAQAQALAQQQQQQQAQAQALAQQQQQALALAQQQQQQQQKQLAQARAMEAHELAAARRSASLVDALLPTDAVLQAALPLLHPSEALVQAGLLAPGALELSDSEVLELIDCLGSGSGSDFFM